MRKRCQLCHRHYFARWRNTAAICDECAPVTLVCTNCLNVVAVVRDPTQLSLFRAEEIVKRQRWSVAALLERFPARATPPKTVWASELADTHETRLYH